MRRPFAGQVIANQPTLIPSIAKLKLPENSVFFEWLAGFRRRSVKIVTMNIDGAAGGR